jgi:hypothetical protein
VVPEEETVVSWFGDVEQNSDAFHGLPDSASLQRSRALAERLQRQRDNRALLKQLGLSPNCL